MRKIWRVILLIVLVSVLLGAVCLGVGIVTGAEFDRIYSVLDSQYGLDSYINNVNSFFIALQNAGVL